MTREAEVSVPVLDQFPAFEEDGFSKRTGLNPGDFTATVFRDSVVLALAVTITEIGVTGEYKTSFVPPTIGFYELQILVDFNKEIRFSDYIVVPEITNTVVIETRDKVFEIATSSDAIDEQLAAALGLLHQNSMIDNYTFDGNDQLLTARLRVFADSASVPPTPGGAEVGILEFAVDVTYSGLGKPNKYVLKQVP